VSTGGGRTGPAGGPGVRVLVAHDDPTARDDLVAQLEASGRVEVVGTARSGDAAVALARKHAPDIVLVAEHLPAQGGPAVVEAVGALLPACGAILLLEELTADSMQRAMAVGARQIVPMPPPPGELLQAIGQVHAALAERRSAGSGVAPPPVVGCGGQIVAVFSLKGGVGCTTVAANLAVAIRQEMGLRVALVDASLPLGDIGALLDLPSTRSLTDLVGVRAQGDEAAAVEDALTTHGRSGVRVVQAPHRAELAETVTGDLLQRALGTLRAHHEYVVVDTYAALDERVLPVLELADTILLVLTPDVAAIRSAAVFLGIAALLGYPPDKIIPVVTRAATPDGIATPAVAAALGRPLDHLIPADERTVVRAINAGDPLVLSARGTPVAAAIVALARHVVTVAYPDAGASLAPRGAVARRGPLKRFARG